MKAKHSLSRLAVAGAVLAIALAAGAGPSVAAPEGRGRGNEKRVEKREKQRKPRVSRAAKPNHRQEARSRASRPGDRRDRSEARHESRRRDDRREVRHDSRRGDSRYDHRGPVIYPDRHRFTVRRHHPGRYVIRRHAPRVVFRPRVLINVGGHRPWYHDARRIYVDDDAFYFNASLGLYLGGLALNVQIGDVAPYGYVYYDPFCGETFWTLTSYRSHLWGYPHPHALTLIPLDDCTYDY